MEVYATIIGFEILSGKRRDRHLDFLVRTLAKRGLELCAARYIGDHPEQLTRELAHSFDSTKTTHAVTFCFGGIGATPDDHTRQCAADALGVPLQRHPEAGAFLLERFGQGAYPQRIRMADFPRGAELIPNPINKVAGFSVAHHHFVPGFPRMAWPMVEWVLDTRYRASFALEQPIEIIGTLRGVSEGEVVGLLEQFVERFPSLRLSCLPHANGAYRETELGVRGRPAQAQAAMDWLESALKTHGFELEHVRSGQSMLL